jgi:hypothetical protein
VSLNAFSYASPGAGRFLDYELDLQGLMGFPPTTWTQTFSKTILTALPGISRVAGLPGTTRLQTTTLNGFVTLNGGVAPAIGLYQNVMCLRYAPNSGSVSAEGHPTWLFQQPVHNITTDEPQVFRYVCTMATAPVTGASTGDGGLALIVNNGLNPNIRNATAGFGVQWNGVTGLPEFITRRATAGALVVTPLPGGAADNDWHTVEFRFFNATIGAPAQLLVLWDNVQQLALNWGAGTTLPDYSSVATLIALIPQFAQLTGSGSPFIYLSRFRVIAGPTLASCL